MFYLIGIGLKPEHLTHEALQALKESQTVYCENYTSMLAQGKIEELEKMIGKKIQLLERKDVESFNFLYQNREKKTGIFSLIVVGNPLIATTHQEILRECQNMKIQFKAIPGLSIVDFVPFSGLDAYKFGRTCTLVAPKVNFAPESFFDVILKNKFSGLHTLCLLEITEEKYFMPIHEALKVIEDIAKKRKIDTENWILIGLAGMGNEEQQVKAGKLEELKKFDFEILPQCFIVAGDVNEKELEGLTAFAGWNH